MACVHPLKAYKCFGFEVRGKTVVFSRPSYVPAFCKVEEIALPCGQCIECRRKYSFDWALRMQAEADLHDVNCFLTLTYDDAHLRLSPSGSPTLFYSDFSSFLKRLRRRIEPDSVRFYMCGEYGEQTHRPHYHAILFGYFPKDAKLLFRKSNGSSIFRSRFLEELWPYGLVGITDVAFECYAYVSGYMMKKRKGLDAQAFYGDRMPEKSLMSRRPGIAHDWYKRYSADVYPRDHVIARGVETKPPRYFDRLYMSENIDKYLVMKKKRKENLIEFSAARLEAKEKISKCLQALKQRNTF